MKRKRTQHDIFCFLLCFCSSSFATLYCVLLTLTRVDSSNTQPVGSEGKMVYCTDRNRESKNILGQHTIKVHYYEANRFVLSESYTILLLAVPNEILPCCFHHQAHMQLSTFPGVDNRKYIMYGAWAILPSVNLSFFHTFSSLFEILKSNDLC